MRGQRKGYEVCGGAPESPLSMSPERPRYATGTLIFFMKNKRVKKITIGWLIGNFVKSTSSILLFDSTLSTLSSMFVDYFSCR